MNSMPFQVVNVNANGLDLDFICIGDNTERLEMRTYAIEELLSYSPSHELCGSIYEEDEDVDNSPIDEVLALGLYLGLM